MFFAPGHRLDSCQRTYLSQPFLVRSKIVYIYAHLDYPPNPAFFINYMFDHNSTLGARLGLENHQLQSSATTTNITSRSIIITATTITTCSVPLIVLQTRSIDILLYSRGVHIIVATPGRLMDLLDKKIVNLDICRYGQEQ
jgi:hypothetical protein